MLKASRARASRLACEFERCCCAITAAHPPLSSCSIDSGIDYTHPNLGGGIGEGKLVVGGYDFVGDDYTDSRSTPVPDSDPLDQCNGHGTHVAGILAMQPGNEFGVSGVAYESSLMAYRIFGCSGGTSEDIAIAALLRAYDDGCDVITLSLGITTGWSTGASSVVASNIAAEGRVVVVAAGNDGREGAWYGASPANGLGVISVGSVDNTGLLYSTLTVSGAEHEPIPYFLYSQPANGFAALNVTGEWPLYALSTDLAVASDGCEPLSSSVPDLSKFITIVRRGGCTSNTSDFGRVLTVIFSQALSIPRSTTSLRRAAKLSSLPTTAASSNPAHTTLPSPRSW